MAQENFDAASELARGGRFRRSISRAYYASYCLVVSRLVSQNVTLPTRGNPTHSKLPALVLNSMRGISSGRRGNLAGVLMVLYRLRVAADYQPTVSVDTADARIAAGLMQQVFRDIKEANQ